MKIGLYLSSSGIKGVAHIGVIKALEDENIKVDCISSAMGIMMHELYNYEVQGIEYLLQINTEYVGLLEIEETGVLYNIGYIQLKSKWIK